MRASCKYRDRAQAERLLRYKIPTVSPGGVSRMMAAASWKASDMSREETRSTAPPSGLVGIRSLSKRSGLWRINPSQRERISGRLRWLCSIFNTLAPGKVLGNCRMPLGSAPRKP